MTGHTHYRFEAEEYSDFLKKKQIDNSNCYSMHVPSNNFAREWTTSDIWRDGYQDNAGSQGYWVDVYEKGVIYKAMDFAKADIGEKMMQLGNPQSGSLYMNVDTVPDNIIDTISVATARNCFMPDYQYYLPIANSSVKPANFVEIDKTTITISEGMPSSLAVKLGVEGGSVQLECSSNDLKITPSTLTFTDADFATEQMVEIDVQSAAATGMYSISILLDGELQKVVNVKVLAPLDESLLTRLEYIIVNDGAYWNLDYVPQPSTTVEMKAEINNYSREWFGCNADNNQTNFILHYNSNGTLQTRLGDSEGTYTADLRGVPHTIKVDAENKQLWIDGSLGGTYSDAKYTVANGVPMGVCSFNINGVFDSERQDKYHWTNEKLYYVKIWEGSTLVHEYIPVHYQVDNQLYLYDTVAKQLYTNPLGRVSSSSSNQ